MQKPLSTKTLEKKYAELGLSKAKTEMLHTYFLCFANLYGVISLRDAWNVFKHYEGASVRKKDFIAFSGIVQREAGHPYSVFELKEIYSGENTDDPLERMIVNNKLILSGFHRFFHIYVIVERQGRKPYYLPGKQVFLSFSEDRFYLTPLGRKMRSFAEGLKTRGICSGYGRTAEIKLYDTEGNPVKGKRLTEFVFFTPYEQYDIEYFKSERKKQKLRVEYSITAAEKVLNRIYLDIMTGCSMPEEGMGKELQHIVDYLRTNIGVELSKKQLEKFEELFVRLNNSSNLWLNCGWSPAALFQELYSGAPKAVFCGPNMQKMFASGELNEAEFGQRLTEMGIEWINE